MTSGVAIGAQPFKTVTSRSYTTSTIPIS